MKRAPEDESLIETNFRDDYDTRDNNNDDMIEEERIRLFSRSPSLSFSIDHYCMMIEKVYISFLKLFKLYCTSSNDNTEDNNHIIMKAYTLGKQLQVFLKEVLPSRILYHTDLKGRQRITTIGEQVDEYVNILTVAAGENKYDNFTSCRHYFEDSYAPCNNIFASCSKNSDEDERRTECNNIYDDEYTSVQGIHFNRVDHNEEQSCSSSSFSIPGYICWDELDDIEHDYEGEDIDGFILKEISKASDGSISVDEDVDFVSGELPDFKFKTLVAHWRAEEEKWKARK